MGFETGPVHRLSRTEKPQAADGPVDSRRRLLLISVATALVVTIGGMLVAQLVKSPAERAAEADAPPRSLISAAVESRRLVDTVVIRGTVTAAQSVDVSAAGAGKSGGDSGGAPVVTDVRVKTGDQVNAGQVLLEISGRPVFVLSGAVPAYRDLKPGSEGKDVDQLQKALAGIGLKSGADRPGAYGTGTRDAVAALYQRLGYSAPQAAGGGDGKGAPDPAQSGAMVPAGEVVFLSGFPGRVDAVDAQLGTAPPEKALRLSTGALVVRGSVAPHEKGLLRTGMPVTMLSEVTGIEAAGVISTVSDTPVAPKSVGGEQAKDDVSGPRNHEVVVTPSKPLDPKLSGQDVRLTIEAAASAGPVLVVPVTAISSGADGRTVVTVLSADGTKSRVEVRSGTTGDGFVQVTPAAGAQLKPGDQVVVGVNSAPRAAPTDSPR